MLNAFPLNAVAEIHRLTQRKAEPAMVGSPASITPSTASAC
jgi:hypothetical protein